MSKSLKLIVEALLFASDKPLSAREIHNTLPDVKLNEIKNTLETLKQEYEEMDRSFIIKVIADGYQFRSHAEYGPYILTMLQTSPNRLSRAALETLSIIAYKQPILRQEIERYRGVDVGGILKMLGEKDLIKIMGRKDLPGRPLIYGTTKKFLEVFDLQNIEALPKLKEIEALGAGEHEPETTEEDYPEGETIAPEGETITPEGETITPEGETIAPEGETISAEGGIIFSERETISQGGQRPPEVETISQEGQSPSEVETDSQDESSASGEQSPAEVEGEASGKASSDPSAD